jgi:hypothetical protein
VHASKAFSRLSLTDIGAEDIANFNQMLRDQGCTASTRAKHLRVLGACLQAAVFYGHADSNPVRKLPPAQRPRPERKEAAYFENHELPWLFEHLIEEPHRSGCSDSSGSTSTSSRLSLASDGHTQAERSARLRTAKGATST